MKTNKNDNHIKKIKIDFNKDTFESLSKRLLCIKDYIVIMNHNQFETFKLMYRFIHKKIDETGIAKETITFPTTMGYIYGIEYKVEN